MSVSILFGSTAQAFAPKQMEFRTPAFAKKFAKSQLPFWGWKNQWSCLHRLWTNESNWRPNARNKTPVWVIKDGKRIKVHAGGVAQILGLDPATPTIKQVNLGLKYIKHRHQTPCRALAYWNRHYSY